MVRINRQITFFFYEKSRQDSESGKLIIDALIIVVKKYHSLLTDIYEEINLNIILSDKFSFVITKYNSKFKIINENWSLIN